MRLCLRSGGHDPARDGDRPMVDGNRLGMPIDPREIGGHRVVLLLIQVDSAGDALDDDQHAMRTGEARWDGRTLWLDCGEAEPPFAVIRIGWSGSDPCRPESWPMIPGLRST
jgi:hypothetical protein